MSILHGPHTELLTWESLALQVGMGNDVSGYKNFLRNQKNVSEEILAREGISRGQLIKLFYEESESADPVTNEIDDDENKPDTKTAPIEAAVYFWASLMGTDEKRLIRSLAREIEGCDGDTVLTAQKMYEVFGRRFLTQLWDTSKTVFHPKEYLPDQPAEPVQNGEVTAVDAVVTSVANDIIAPTVRPTKRIMHGYHSLPGTPHSADSSDWKTILGMGEAQWMALESKLSHKQKYFRQEIIACIGADTFNELVTKNGYKKYWVRGGGAKAKTESREEQKKSTPTLVHTAAVKEPSIVESVATQASTEIVGEKLPAVAKVADWAEILSCDLERLKMKIGGMEPVEGSRDSYELAVIVELVGIHQFNNRVTKNGYEPAAIVWDTELESIAFRAGSEVPDFGRQMPPMHARLSEMAIITSLHTNEIQWLSKQVDIEMSDDCTLVLIASLLTLKKLNQRLKKNGFRMLQAADLDRVPVREKSTHFVYDADYEPENTEDYEPTNAMPGSNWKVNILAERLKNGQPLWHVKDRRSYDDSDED